MARYDEVEVNPDAMAASLRRQATGSNNPRAGWSRSQWITEADELLREHGQAGVKRLQLGHVVNLIAEVHDLHRRLAELGAAR